MRIIGKARQCRSQEQYVHLCAIAEFVLISNRRDDGLIDDTPSYHDPIDFFESANIVERIGRDCDHIR